MCGHRMDAETIQAEQTAAAENRDNEMACRDVEEERVVETASNATEGWRGGLVVTLYITYIVTLVYGDFVSSLCYFSMRF